MTSLDSTEKTILFLQEKCDYAFNGQRPMASLPILRELLTLKPNFWVRLKTQLRICECLIRIHSPILKNDDDFEITKTLDLITTAPRVGVNDMIELANIHLQNNSHLQVILLFNCACKLHQLDSPPNDAVIGIMECFRKIRESAIRTIDSPNFPATVVSIAMRMMHSRLDNLRTICDADSEVRTETEVICMNNIAMILSSDDQKAESETFYDRALKIMLDKFGQRAYRFFICSALLHNLGLARMAEDDLDAAERYFEQALDANGLAENFPNELQKVQWRQGSEINLQYVRQKIRSFASKKGRGGG